MRNSASANRQRYFERLTLNQRVQHIVLMAGFFLLVLTGLPLRYPEAVVSSKIIHLLGGFTVRSVVHRTAAILLIGVCVYHLFYTALSRHGRSELRAFVPNKKDLLDVLHMIGFYLGFKSDTPRFDRFNYIEKLEYLAMGWGSVVMIITGLMLWFEGEAMILIPKWALDVARVIHSYEAVLAFLAIIIWHFYHVHLNPEVFPGSRIWLDGKISEHEMALHHPIEYARVAGASPAEKEAEPAPVSESRTPAGILTRRE